MAAGKPRSILVLGAGQAAASLPTSPSGDCRNTLGRFERAFRARGPLAGEPRGPFVVCAPPVWLDVYG
jgi:hypothetical protein